jgi:glycosyltransferase involved in cell wall biosynthesis
MAEPARAVPGPSTTAQRPTVCYVVPSHTAGDSSHLAHLPRFLDEVGRRCRLHVIVERGVEAPIIPSACSVQLQTQRRRLPRMIELGRMAMALQRQGCEAFFVRISPGAAFVLNVLGRVSGVRVYYWMSGQPRNLWPSWRQLRRRVDFEIGDRIARLNARLAHRLVTGPEAMLAYYRRELGVPPEKLTLLYNDVPCATSPMTRTEARKRLGLAPDAQVVLFVGRVSPLKGGGNLLGLATALRARVPAASLLVVGDAGAMPDVPAAIRRAGLDNVTFVGAVPNGDLAPYYRAADVFVLPSESEGFPRVLLEAMQHGVPSVAFDVGGVRDILAQGQQQFVVDRRDVDAMALLVARLLRDDRLRADHVRLGLERVQTFSTENVAEMFVAAVGTEPCASH